MITIAKFSTFLFLVLFILSCSPKPEVPTEIPDGTIPEKLEFVKNADNFNSESERLGALFEVYAEAKLIASPTNATMWGMPGYNHLWDDMSPEGVAKQLDELEIFYGTRDWFKTEELTEEDIVNFKIYNASVKSDYDLTTKYPEQYLIIDQIFGVHNMIAMVLQMMPTNSKEDLANIQSRLEGIPQLLADAETTLREGVEKGIVMPKNTVVQVPTQLNALIVENPDESVFFQPFAEIKEEINLENVSSLQEDVRKIIVEKVNPALAQFNDFMAQDYIPNTRETYGLKDLPDGVNWYNERIRKNTTTNLTALEIHELGKSEVARIRQEMESIIQQVGFKGDFDAFNKFMRDDPQFFLDSPEALLKEYRDICKRIDPILPTLFGKLPRQPYGVRAVPAYSEKSTPPAYYIPGSVKAGVPGYFYANTYNLKSRPTWGMAALCIHEAVPGHHLQLAIANEMENVPDFRSMLFITAYSEGWGLYSESLGEEMGMYKDPYTKYGRLTYEMWRAIRLVVDTGIHALGWSRQEAIDYFKANSGIADSDIIVEVDRYIAWPGQALAYKIGELKIKELRKKAETTLKDDFDIRAFHDVVLGSGAVPLDVLEYNVDAWIAEVQKVES